MKSDRFDAGDAIFSYTREQAIEDGVLVDVSDDARGVGFVLPVALTRSVWEHYVEWTDHDCRRQFYQDRSERLLNVLWTAMQAARRKPSSSVSLFSLWAVPRGGHRIRPRKTTLKLHVGPDDDGSPVLTILLPDED